MQQQQQVLLAAVMNTGCSREEDQQEGDTGEQQLRRWQQQQQQLVVFRYIHNVTCETVDLCVSCCLVFRWPKPLVVPSELVSMFVKNDI